MENIFLITNGWQMQSGKSIQLQQKIAVKVMSQQRTGPIWQNLIVSILLFHLNCKISLNLKTFWIRISQMIWDSTSKLKSSKSHEKISDMYLVFSLSQINSA